MQRSFACFLYASSLALAGGFRVSRTNATKATCSNLYSGIRGTRERYLITAASAAGLGSTELAQFMAQCAHECDSFNTMEEYASGSAYEGRRDLGNIYPGDGRRYKGRGYIQITGRANYRTYGNRIGVNLEANPLRASEGPIAARVALEYWRNIVKPRVSNFRDTRTVTRLINGGYNGLQDRINKFAQYQRLCTGGGGGLPSGEGSTCEGDRGLCIDTQKSRCPRAVLSGLCSGGSNIKCCPSSSPGVGAPCNGVAGFCIDTAKTKCPRTTQSGRCPGGASIQCCPLDAQSVRNGAGKSCSTGWVLNGTCIDVNKDKCHTATFSGKCGQQVLGCCPRFPPA